MFRPHYIHVRCMCLFVSFGLQFEPWLTCCRSLFVDMSKEREACADLSGVACEWFQSEAMLNQWSATLNVLSATRPPKSLVDHLSFYPRCFVRFPSKPRLRTT